MSYKNIHLICWLFLLPFLAASQNAVVLSGGSLVQTGGQIVIKDGSLVNDASINQLSGSLKLTGTASDAHSQIGGASATTLLNLEIAKSTNNVTLGQNVSVSTQLQLNGGLLDIINANLTLAPGATVSGANANRYVRTSGSGQLLLTINNSSQTIPVGNALYNPFIATNNGIADVFGVRVMDVLLEQGTTGSAFTEDGVGVSWNINQMNTGGADLSLNFQWNGSQELSGFDRTDMSAMRFNGAFWDLQGTSGMATGSDPYQFMASGITEVGVFGLFKSELPDLDGDGFGSATDCNDDNPDINPDATEICNGVDDNCSTLIDTEDPELVDNIPPTAVCENFTVQLDTDGQATISPEDIGNSSYDDCSVMLSLDQTSFTCEDLGYNTVHLIVTDAGGNTDDCSATVLVEPNMALPDGWYANNIGSNPQGTDYSFDPCSGTIPANGNFTITGSGNNATSTTTDNVAFLSQEICGNGSITAKVESVDPNGYGGLMIRETTNANAKQVAIFSNLSAVLRHETRYLSGANKVIGSFYKPAPFWLRLERQGNWIFAYYSTTGSSFQYVHGVYVPMQACVQFGLASFTYLPNAQTESVFSNVSVVGNGGTMSTGETVIEAGNELSEFGTASASLYPNPSSGQVTLQLGEILQSEATVLLYNQLGQILKQHQLLPGDQYMDWDMSALSDGVYYIEIQRKEQQPELLRMVKSQ